MFATIVNRTGCPIVLQGQACAFVQMSRSRSYVFTLNNYTKEEELYVQGLECVYLVYGREVGKSGTPHLQGFIKFRNGRSESTVRKLLPRAHVEVCRDVERAIQYSKKDGDCFEKGVEPQKNGGDKAVEIAEKNKRLREAPLEELVRTGELSLNQVPIIKKARVILDQENSLYEHDQVRGVWIYGPPGTGKTHLARSYGDVYLKAQNKWFDGYTGQATIVLDDFDSQGSCLGHYLKIWADKWSCTGEIKGGTVNLQHRKFIVTSNYHPSELFEDKQMLDAILRRFELKNLLIKYN